MTASILDGKEIANIIRSKLKTQVALENKHPGLAVILLGDDPASRVYVESKRKACAEVGFKSFAYDLPNDTSEPTLLALIEELNRNPEVHGILVQLPLPEHIDSRKIIEKISPIKDVDGFHPYNIGRLMQRHPLLRPCTPYGVIQLLAAYQIDLYGKHAVVVGASNIVGRPMALEFLLAGSTVTICHRFTKNLECLIRMAEIIVVATGVCDVIHPDWLHKEQILIDIGMHRLDSGLLRGDIDFMQAKERVSWIAPVPGGVGPMTIATLLQNTWLAASLGQG